MKERLLIATAIGLMLGSGAFAQSPGDKSKTEPPPRGAKPDQSKSISTGPLVELFSEFGAVCPERPSDLFR